MPANAVFLLIRHAEKPESGTGLTPLGERHAQSYAHFFPSYHLGPRLLTIAALFAAADTPSSARPRLTLMPLASALKLPIETRYESKQFGELAGRLLSKEFDGRNAVICWKRGEILDLADALGARARDLRPKTQ